MRLRFKISKSANKFFFIQNLTEWHFSCSPEMNKEWLRRTGPFTREERKFLKLFEDKILRKYSFSLWDVFYAAPERKAFNSLRIMAGKATYEIARDVFHVFEKRFSKVWRLYGPSGRSNLKELEKFARSVRAQKLLDEAGRLFGGRKTGIFTCIVLFSPLRTALGGSANMKSPTITLNLPHRHLSRKYLARIVCVIAHEMGHALFKKRGGKKIIESIIKKFKLPERMNILPLSTNELINESITASFVPRGYLAQKHFPKELKERIAQSFRDGAATERAAARGKKVRFYNGLDGYFVQKLWPQALEYVRGNKPIDRAYLEKAAELISDFLK